jgi:hypothetical protein
MSTRRGFAMLRASVERYVPNALQGIFTKLCNFLYSFVDPAREAAAAQQQAQGGGSRCTIM